MAELRIVAVSVEQRVREVRLPELTHADGCGEPSVVGLSGELEDPARHRHGHPVGGELTHERVEPCPGSCA